MQSYKSSKNLALETKTSKRMEKQHGEIPFELAPNTSGRITTKFTAPYPDVPFIHITPIVLQEEIAFDLNYAITARSKTEFVVNIQNTSDMVMKGALLWFASR